MTLTSPQRKPQLDEFLEAHHQLLRDFMDGALRGRADLDDALQHGLMRIMRDYEDWPQHQTADQRLAYARKTIQWAAADVLRQEYGRTDRAPRPREIPISLTDYDQSADAEQGSREALRGLIRERLSDLATAGMDEDGRLDRELYVSALAALDPREHEIVTEHARGFEHKELAERLGESEQKVRATYSEARKLLLTLLACSRGRDVREAEDLDLFGYLEGTLTDKRHRRLVKRHLRSCDNCQSIASLHGDVDHFSHRLVLPVPLALAALKAGTAVAATGAGAAGASTAGAGAAAGATSGATSGVASGGLLSGVGGKIAASVAAAVVAGGGATIATHARDEPTPRTAPAAAAAEPAPRLARPTPLTVRPKPQRRARPARRQPEQTGEPEQQRQATTQPDQPVVRPAAPDPKPRQRGAATGSGGEFLVGSE